MNQPRSVVANHTNSDLIFDIAGIGLWTLYNSEGNLVTTVRIRAGLFLSRSVFINQFLEST